MQQCLQIVIKRVQKGVTRVRKSFQKLKNATIDFTNQSFKFMTDLRAPSHKQEGYDLPGQKNVVKVAKEWSKDKTSSLVLAVKELGDKMNSKVNKLFGAVDEDEEDETFRNFNKLRNDMLLQNSPAGETFPSKSNNIEDDSLEDLRNRILRLQQGSP